MGLHRNTAYLKTNITIRLKGYAHVLFLVSNLESSAKLNFTYNGFSSANLSVDGVANITRNGLLELTNETKPSIGLAFHPARINFKNSNGTALSFSSSFVFDTFSNVPALKGHGMVFVIAPNLGLRRSRADEYLGVFSPINDGKSTNHVFAFEIDTNYVPAFNDTNGNHVGIDINSIYSDVTSLAGYHDDNINGAFRNLSLFSGKAMQIWLEHDDLNKKILVTLAPIKPKIPLWSLARDLSPILDEFMYVGFSAATGSSLASHHYVLGWSLTISGHAQELNISQLPRLPHIGPKKRSMSDVQTTLHGFSALAQRFGSNMSEQQEEELYLMWREMVVLLKDSAPDVRPVKEVSPMLLQAIRTVWQSLCITTSTPIYDAGQAFHPL
ncbi:LOW QUALITY PROTEIN: Legume lectin domain [Dillenia turbinata]|uniref:Legume lectin domain n=1 Tax=Dillenia turbinata TaxID=194707 RepID=A0AAN8VY47_9MAGN